MYSIGPQLPAHLTKRKRSLDTPPSVNPPKHSRPRLSTDPHPHNDSNDASQPSHPNADEIDLDVASPQTHSSDDDIGPSLPNTSHTSNHHSPDEDSSAIGPTLPNITSHASQDEDGSSSDDDDFGPSLPSTRPSRTIGPTLPPSTHSDSPRRDDWMLAPPPSSSTFSERDPTHLRARKFASRAKPPAGPADTTIWTETPEEKLRRLRDSVLGRTEDKEDRRAGEQRERDRTVADTIKATRGKSLYEEHVDRKRDEQHKGEAEDDPSKRAFDREKDMALGGRVNATQRRQLINKSANFGDRFSKGSFL